MTLREKGFKKAEEILTINTLECTYFWCRKNVGCRSFVKVKYQGHKEKGCYRGISVSQTQLVSSLFSTKSDSLSLFMSAMNLSSADVFNPYMPLLALPIQQQIKI